MAHEPELISRARAGDRRALRELVVAWQGPVARFVLAQIGERGEVEDVCQAVFVKTVKGLPRLQEAAAFEGWLFRIARNACNDWKRRRRWQRRLFVALTPAHEAVPAVEMPRDGTAALATALGQLPAPQRELVALSLDGKHSYEEMARMQAVSVPAFKSRLFRARELLKKLVAGERSEE